MKDNDKGGKTVKGIKKISNMNIVKMYYLIIKINLRIVIIMKTLHILILLAKEENSKMRPLEFQSLN